MTEVGVLERYARNVIVVTAIATCSTPTSSRLPAVHSATVDCCTVVDGRTPSQTISPLAGSYLSGRQMVANISQDNTREKRNSQIVCIYNSAAAGVTALGLFGKTSHAAEASSFGRRQSGGSLKFTNLSEIPPRSSRCMTSFRLAKGNF